MAGVNRKKLGYNHFQIIISYCTGQYIMDELDPGDIPEQMHFVSGEMPGRGTYRCRNCSVKWMLQDFDELPECPGCRGNDFEMEDNRDIF